jgi:hypothetical protein
MTYTINALHATYIATAMVLSNDDFPLNIFHDSVKHDYY